MTWKMRERRLDALLLRLRVAAEGKAEELLVVFTELAGAIAVPLLAVALLLLLPTPGKLSVQLPGPAVAAGSCCCSMDALLSMSCSPSASRSVAVWLKAGE